MWASRTMTKTSRHTDRANTRGVNIQLLFSVIITVVLDNVTSCAPTCWGKTEQQHALNCQQSGEDQLKHSLPRSILWQALFSEIDLWTFLRHTLRNRIVLIFIRVKFCHVTRLKLPPASSPQNTRWSSGENQEPEKERSAGMRCTGVGGYYGQLQTKLSLLNILKRYRRPRPGPRYQREVLNRQP